MDTESGPCNISKPRSWNFYVSCPDEMAQKLYVMLSFPNGDRRCIEVWDTTTLKVNLFNF